jgi:SAM-dependent methyltransferase
MICTLCGSTLINKKDAYFYDCATCRALVKDDTYYLTAAEEKAEYDLHNNDVHDVRYQQFTMPITAYVLDHFLPAHKGLDFGSGTGPVISSMLKKQGYDIVQYDPFFAPNQKVLGHKYDYIVSCEVFEHFHNPKMEIDRLTSLLKPNGMLLIMTMLYADQIDFKTWNYRRDATHVFIYRKETIEYIANEKSLEIDTLTDRFIALKKS